MFRCLAGQSGRAQSETHGVAAMGTLKQGPGARGSDAAMHCEKLLTSSWPWYGSLQGRDAVCVEQEQHPQTAAMTIPHVELDTHITLQGLCGYSQTQARPFPCKFERTMDSPTIGR